MKEIKAYIRANKLDEVVQALENAGATDMTIIPIEAIGKDLDDVSVYLKGVLDKYKYNKVAKLEMVCTAEDVSTFTDAIREHGYTGQPGDGMIFIGNIEGAIKIRTGESGKKVLKPSSK